MDRRPASSIALASIAVAIGVLGLKVVAWRMTGSVALYSDALESIVNVAAAIAAFLAVRLSDRPADANHPFGHHKAEYLSAVLEGALIVLASIAVLDAAWAAWLSPRAIEAPAAGLAVNALAGVLNGAWGTYLIRRGTRGRSPALVADGWHLISDTVSSAGVLAGLIAALLTGIVALDAILAGIVGVYILWAGWHLVRDSVGGLMDEATSPDEALKISGIIAEQAAGAIEVHDIRTRRAGRVTFAEFHLVVAGSMTVADAHTICDRIEAALRAAIPGIRSTIHVEPEAKAKDHGAIRLS